MGKIRLIGAVGIKVRPDASDFKKELRDQVNNLPDYEINVSIDADTTPVGKAVKQAKAKAEAETINLRVDADYDGVKRGIAKIEGMLKSLDAKDIPVTLDRKGLLKAKKDLAAMAKAAEVDFKFTKDEAGYRSVLQKIENIRRQKLVKEIKFTTDAKSLRDQERIAKQALAKIEANRTIEIRYGNNYDGIQSAIDDVDKRLEALRQLKLVTKLDRASLLEARKKLTDRLANASVTVNYNEDKAGYESVLKKIRDIQKKKLEKKISFKTDDQSLEDEAAKFEKLIADATPPRTIEIAYHHDRGSLEAAIKKIDDELQTLSAIKMPPVTADAESLEAARDELQAMLDAEPFRMTYSEDKAGYESVLKKVRALQAEKVALEVTFDTDDAALAALAQEMEDNLKGLEEKAKITLHVNNDTNDLLKAVAQIDAALHDLGKVKVEVDLDEDQLLAKRAELEAALVDSKFKIKIDTTDPNDLAAKRIEVQKMLDSFKPKLEMQIENNPESIHRALYEIDRAKAEAEKKKIKLEVESTGLGLMAARLAVATRPRTVPFYIRINEKSLLVAEGILKSLSGSNVLTSLGRQFENIFTKFDTYALKTSTLAVGLGSIVDTLSYVGTTMFSIGEGISQSIGLLAVAPALLTTFAAGLFVYTAAFDNFSNAFSEDVKKRNQAMKELPPNARKAVDSLRGLYKEIARPVQDSFWETMGTSLQDAINHLIPQVKDGLIGMASGAGKFTAGILDSFTEIAQNKQLEAMFENIAGFMDLTGQAAKPFFDGFNQFGVRGSEFLPKFGDWLLTMSQRFDDWATRSSNNGDINRWIEEGVQSLQDMWDVGGSVIRMFQGITSAALAAGGSTLTEFAENLSGIADTMNGEPFQSRAANIFRGAREGASLLNVGFMDLSRSLGESSEWLGMVLEQLGGLGGKFLSNVAVTIDSEPLKKGIDETLGGLDTMLLGLRPSFESLGELIGGLGIIAGSVFGGMAPLINTVSGIVGDLVADLSGNLAEAAEALLSGMTGRITALIAPIELMGNTLNGILGLFNSMPTGIQQIIVALGVFLLLRGQLSKMLTAIGDSKPFTKMRDNWRMAESAAGRFGRENERQFRVTTALYEGAGRQVRDLGTRYQGLTERVRGTEGGMRRMGVVGSAALRGIGTAASGLSAFMGGPLGLAIAGISIVASVIGENAAKAKAKVDDLVTALDGQTGINGATEKVIATQLQAKGSFAFWETNSVAKNAEEIGISMRDLQLAAEGVPESVEAVNEALDKAFDERTGAEKMADFVNGFTEGLGPLRGVGDAIGFMFGSTAAKTAEGLQKIKDDLEAARLQAEKTADQLGIPVNTATGIISAIDTLADKASTADEKLRAVETVLGRLNKKEGADDAVQRANDTARDFVTNMKEIVTLGKSKGIKFGDLVDAAGNIDTVSKAGSDLRTEVMGMAKDGRDAALKLALAQKDPQAAIQTLQDKWGATRKQIGEQLKLAGIPPEEVEAVLRQLDFPPGVVEVLLSGKSKEDMLADIELLQGDMQGKLGPVVGHVTADKTAFDTIIGEAQQRGVNFGTNVFKPTVDGDKNPFEGVIGDSEILGNAFNQFIIKPKVDANKGPFDGILATATGQGRNLGNTTFKPKLDGDKGGFDGKERDVRNRGESLDRSTYSPTINARGNALDVAKDIANTIGGFAGKVFGVTIDIAKMFSGSGSMDGSIFLPGGKAHPQFQPKYFANGGFENHTAQITRPGGPIRVWSEPETQGEAYLPLAMSKRGRSTQILAEVADMFGYRLTRVDQFADGGVVSAGSRERSGPSVAVNIDSYIQQSENTADDVARAIMRRVKSRGVYAPLEGF